MIKNKKLWIGSLVVFLFFVIIILSFIFYPPLENGSLEDSENIFVLMIILFLTVLSFIFGLCFIFLYLNLQQKYSLKQLNSLIKKWILTANIPWLIYLLLRILTSPNKQNCPHLDPNAFITDLIYFIFPIIITSTIAGLFFSFFNFYLEKKYKSNFIRNFLKTSFIFYIIISSLLVLFLITFSNVVGCIKDL